MIFIVVALLVMARINPSITAVARRRVDRYRTRSRPANWMQYPVCTYVPQEPHLFSVSIRENVVMDPNPGTDERTEAVDAALQATALARDVASLPRGAATVVGAAGTNLSGGLRQRLASARAFGFA